MKSPQKRFSIGRFLLLVMSQFTLLLIGFALVFPRTWSVQVSAGFVAVVLTFLGAHLFNCLFEWTFHRYVLHAITLPLVHNFARDHRKHHALTPIRLRSNDVGPGRIVLNRYPIIEVEQFEKSVFPRYALFGFWVAFSPLLIGVQLLLPRAPILLGGYTAITWSMISYEVFHSIEHYPYEWWKRAVEHPRFGWVWQKVYGFHHFHHANVKVNEAIGGFFGLPVFDWLFGTLHVPKQLLLEGRIATAEEFQVKPPRSFIIWLDNWARRQEAKSK